MQSKTSFPSPSIDKNIEVHLQIQVHFHFCLSSALQISEVTQAHWIVGPCRKRKEERRSLTLQDSKEHYFEKHLTDNLKDNLSLPLLAWEEDF